MSELNLGTYAENTWCKGCGNFGILSAIGEAVEGLVAEGTPLELKSRLLGPPLLEMRLAGELDGLVDDIADLVEVHLLDAHFERDPDFDLADVAENSVCYTGTHDNDTTVGWYEASSTADERDYARKYLGTDGTDITWDLIRLAWSSTACTAMTTTQDLLSLGHYARMNTPSTLGPLGSR